MQQKIAIPPLWLLKIRKKTQVHCKGHLQKKTKKAEILIITEDFSFLILWRYWICFLLKTAVAISLKKSRKKCNVFLRRICLSILCFFGHTAAAANSLSESKQVPGGRSAAIRSSNSFQIDFFSFFTGGSSRTPVMSFSLAKRLM